MTQTIYGIVQGFLAQARPGSVPAAGAGQATILAVSLLDATSGRRRVSVVQPMIGGSGGRAAGDGIDGCDFSLGSLANTPTESIENEIPILVQRYEVVPDSGGAGRLRGGLAVRLDFQVFSPDTVLTARGMERFRFQPWGLYGGRAGARGDSWLNPDTPSARRTGKIDVLRLQAGDVFSVRTPGGGGFGHPFMRDPEQVVADVRAGVVSQRAAREDYGVVLTEQGVDREATQRCRESGGAPDGTFDKGPAREEHERLLPPSLADAVAHALFRLPVGLRYHAKQLFFAHLRALDAEGASIAPEEVDAVLGDVLGAHVGGVPTR